MNLSTLMQCSARGCVDDGADIPKAWGRHATTTTWGFGDFSPIHRAYYNYYRLNLRSQS